MLLALVIFYLLITIAIGLWASRRVKNSADFAIAGRHLPLAMIVTTTDPTMHTTATPARARASCGGPPVPLTMRWPRPEPKPIRIAVVDNARQRTMALNNAVPSGSPRKGSLLVIAIPAPSPQRRIVTDDHWLRHQGHTKLSLHRVANRAGQSNHIGR